MLAHIKNLIGGLFHAKDARKAVTMYWDHFENIIANADNIVRICYIPTMYSSNNLRNFDGAFGTVPINKKIMTKSSTTYISINTLPMDSEYWQNPFYFNNINITQPYSKYNNALMNRLISIIEDKVNQSIEEFTDGTFHYVEEV